MKHKKSKFSVLKYADDETLEKLSKLSSVMNQDEQNRVFARIQARCREPHQSPDDYDEEETRHAEPIKRTGIIMNIGAIAACLLVCAGTFGGSIYLSRHPVQNRNEEPTSEAEEHLPETAVTTMTTETTWNTTAETTVPETWNTAQTADETFPAEVRPVTQSSAQTAQSQTTTQTITETTTTERQPALSILTEAKTTGTQFTAESITSETVQQTSAIPETLTETTLTETVQTSTETAEFTRSETTQTSETEIQTTATETSAEAVHELISMSTYRAPLEINDEYTCDKPLYYTITSYDEYLTVLSEIYHYDAWKAYDEELAQQGYEAYWKIYEEYQQELWEATIHHPYEDMEYADVTEADIIARMSDETKEMYYEYQKCAQWESNIENYNDMYEKYDENFFENHDMIIAIWHEEKYSDYFYNEIFFADEKHLIIRGLARFPDPSYPASGFVHVFTTSENLENLDSVVFSFEHVKVQYPYSIYGNINLWH